MVGHSPVFQILLHIAVRMSIMASPPAWTNSAGMLSTALLTGLKHIILRPILRFVLGDNGSSC